MNYEYFGLVQLGQKNPVITPAKTIYVAVHPFFPLTLKDDLLLHKNPNYIASITRLIVDSENPILTLDVKTAVTMEEYKKLGAKGDRFFLENNAIAVPVCGFDALVKIINAFAPSETIFCGAELHAISVNSQSYSQCVGRTYSDLRNSVPNARIEFSLCDVIE